MTFDFAIQTFYKNSQEGTNRWSLIQIVYSNEIKLNIASDSKIKLKHWKKSGLAEKSKIVQTLRKYSTTSENKMCSKKNQSTQMKYTNSHSLTK